MNDNSVLRRRQHICAHLFQPRSKLQQIGAPQTVFEEQCRRQIDSNRLQLAIGFASDTCKTPRRYS